MNSNIDLHIDIETQHIIKYTNYNTLIYNYKLNPKKSGTPDFVAYSGDSRIGVEVKVRKCNSTQYNTYLIEKMKYDKMFEFYLKYKHTINYIPYYFTFFNDKKLYIFDLTDYFEGKKQMIWKIQQHYTNINKTDKTDKLTGYLTSNDIQYIYVI